LYSSKHINFAGDGCLSIPGQYGTTKRVKAVTVEYDKIDGSHHQELVKGYSPSSFTAIIFQHEIDHLNGILFIDRLI
jgi:peptide deformylase